MRHRIQRIWTLLASPPIQDRGRRWRRRRPRWRRFARLSGVRVQRIGPDGFLFRFRRFGRRRRRCNGRSCRCGLTTGPETRILGQSQGRSDLTHRTVGSSSGPDAGASSVPDGRTALHLPHERLLDTFQQNSRPLDGRFHIFLVMVMVVCPVVMVYRLGRVLRLRRTAAAPPSSGRSRFLGVGLSRVSQ